MIVSNTAKVLKALKAGRRTSIEWAAKNGLTSEQYRNSIDYLRRTGHSIDADLKAVITSAGRRWIATHTLTAR